jgi:phosphoribosylamine-glycine ligase
LNIIAVADTIEQAREKAYALNKKIVFEGRQFRNDLGNSINGLPIPTK